MRRKRRKPPPIHAFVPIWNESSTPVSWVLFKKDWRRRFSGQVCCLRGKGTAIQAAAPDEPLRPRDKGHSTETRAQMKRNQENIYTEVTAGIFFF